MVDSYYRSSKSTRKHKNSAALMMDLKTLYGDNGIHGWFSYFKPNILYFKTSQKMAFIRETGTRLIMLLVLISNGGCICCVYIELV